jgi:hypothetical protein
MGPMGPMRQMRGLLHASEFGVADQMLLQVRVQGALPAEPGESLFCFGGKLHLRANIFGDHSMFTGYVFDFRFTALIRGVRGQRLTRYQRAPKWAPKELEMIRIGIGRLSLSGYPIHETYLNR